MSLAPETEMLRQVLPAEFLREKKYEIGGMVARGEMGDIVDAFEATTGRTVAMKVMFSTLSEEEILRFIAEAQITSQLEHPNIVPVHELGVDEEDHVFYTMKLVQGITLRRILRSLAARIPATIVAHPLAVLLTDLQKICDGVAFAHSKSVFHCDLKPGKIKVGEFGEVLVMDWEQARCYATDECALDDEARREAEAADRQRDIAAIGAILYQMLSLRAPAEEGLIEPLVRVNSRRGSTAGTGSGIRNLSHLPGGRIPESLAAVAMKALSPEPGEAYHSVPELQADITAYQDGFATRAERAGPLKQLALLLRRHKREATAFAASIVMLIALGSGAFIYTTWERNVALRERRQAEKERLEAETQRAEAAAQTARAEVEGNRAEKTLSDLRSAAPAYQRQAISFIQGQNFDDALEALGFAVALAPDNSDYQLLRAHVLQTLQRLPEAAESYRRVLALRTEDPAAKSNLELCERLVTAAAGGPLTRELQTQLLNAIVGQKRSADGVFLARALDLQSDTRWLSIREQLKSVTQHPKWTDTRLVKREDGTFALDLSDIPLPSLALLEGLPISELNIARVGVFDLGPLVSLPLRSLDCSGNPIFDLAPLKGLHLLKQLSVDSTRVSDLSPLREIALEDLSLASSAVAELSALRGKPLVALNLKGLPIQSIEALRGMPLQRLDLFGCLQIRDFSALTTVAKLETLNVPAQFTDLTLVQNLRSLKRLGSGDFGSGRAAFEKVPDVATFIAAYGSRLALQARLAPRLEQLRNTLRRLDAPENRIAGVTLGVDGFMDLDLSGLQFDSLGLLEGLPVRRLVIRGTKVSNLTPLRGMPLTLLDAGSTPVTDLAPLAACRTLQVLDVSQTGVTDLRPISVLRLDRLVISNTMVRDLTPLLRMPLRTLRFDETPVEDVRPLATCTALESVTLSRRAHDPSPLRKLASLMRISNEWDARNAQPKQSVSEFWFEYDSSGSARDLDAKLNGMLAKFRLLTGWREDRCEKISGNAYKLDLSDLNVSDLSLLRDLPIAILNVSRTGVTRLGPIANCPIREFTAYECVLVDPAILGRLPLERLEITQDGPSDLQHLRGLKLRSLTLHFKPGPPFTPDLNPLKGMPLETFYAYGFSELASLKALEGAPISRLRVPGAGVKDLSPVRKMPLVELDISSTQITDVSALHGLPLTDVDLMYTKVRDVTPLAECKTLVNIVLPHDAKGIERLRQLPTLKRISFERLSDEDHSPSLQAVEFWAAFPAAKARN